METLDPKKVRRLEVIQIDKEHRWRGCIAIVDEVKPWGVQAYCTVPHGYDGGTGCAFIRLAWGEFHRTGGLVPNDAAHG